MSYRMLDWRYYGIGILFIPLTRQKLVRRWGYRRSYGLRIYAFGLFVLTLDYHPYRKTQFSTSVERILE